MEETLKITNVLSDPTRYYIYQYITNQHQDVTVQEIADHFNIHPNVARLHLSKLEDVNMLISETKKTGKGGRPSRLYRLSDEVIQLHFPFRDYHLLAQIAIETMMSLGEEGKKALYNTGRKLGSELMEKALSKNPANGRQLTYEEKIHLIKEAAITAGFHPEFEIKQGEKKVYFQIFNCPFKEIARTHTETVCSMHYQFLKGMFAALFDDFELNGIDNMLNDCVACSYQADFAN
ncbi:helix-turn-helix domain-containing protein [Bacillaceae bacterium Marseille-Q3522]|nr:helix-turn-helix domain-containing protein [Bacillaceae bacterium Marseille-Q3522]